MKIVVIGGSGLIGKKLVPILRQQGHEAVSASPSSGVNTLTGEGLAGALAGANVVVDVSNSPSWADAAVMEFFDTSTRNLLAAEAAAGVGHHVALSVVGADRMPDSGYMRAKVNQEKLIEAGGVPYSIVRATQFFEFLGGIADSGAEGDTVRLSTAPMQPLAADDVAAALADVAVGAPLNATVELAGPEAMSIAEFVGRFMAASGDKRTVIADPQARYSGAVMDEPRDRTGSESASRPDAVRGLVRPRWHQFRALWQIERVFRSSPSKNPIVRPRVGTAIPSVYPGVAEGPSIGKKVSTVGIGRTCDELIEHVAEVRPRFEAVPRRAAAHAHAQEHRCGLQPCCVSQYSCSSARIIATASSRVQNNSHLIGWSMCRMSDSRQWRHGVHDVASRIATTKVSAISSNRPE